MQPPYGPSGGSPYGGAPPGPIGGVPPPGGAPPGGFVPPPAGTFGAYPTTVSKPINSDAIIALVLGIVTLSSSCFPLGFAAVYFGSKARKKAAEENDTGTSPTLALVGMILGGAFGVLWLLFWLLEAAALILGVGMAIFSRP